MTSRDKAIQLAAAAICLVALLLSGALATQITAEAGKAQLVYTDKAAEGDPPSVAVGIAMGAFRGLFVNYLWLRANRLKEEGKFYEAIELSSAITKLQPRFPRVWAFHAWNMAYNISVATKTRDERWQWVSAGVNLLRDEAIPKNPNDVLLYKELAWIFVHKIQGFADDSNRYYKKMLAQEWTIVLGTPPKLPDSTPDAVEAMKEFLRPVAEAPDAIDELYEIDRARIRAALPPEQQTQAVTSEVRTLVERLETEAGLTLDAELLRLMAYNRAMSSSWFSESNLVRLADNRKNDALSALLADEALTPAWELLTPFVRRKVLRNDYNMKPYFMLQLMDFYGPLDFRHPATHALYWAALGVDEALQRKSIENFDTLNTDRITLHAMQELWRTGTIFYDIVTNEYLTLTNLHFTDYYGDIMEYLAKRGGVAESRERSFTLYRAGYENFLKDVIRAYYRMGDRATAQKYYERYALWEGRTTNDAENMLETMLPLDEFVLRQLDEDRLTIPYVFSSEVFGALTDAYIRGLLGNDQRLFTSQWNYAQKVHKHYFDRHDLTEVASGGERSRMEEMPEDFGEVAGLVLQRLITSGAVESLQASRIYERSPETLQKLVYDASAATMASRGMPENVFRRLFPEPPGMAAFREARAQQRDAERARIERLQLEQQ